MPTIESVLRTMADPDYRTFQSRLLPTVDPARIIGVRTPVLRRYAREIFGTPAAVAFLADLPHVAYDEDNLHACLVSMMRDRPSLIAALDAFLPYVDNWATCDMLRPPLLGRDPAALRCDIARWMGDMHPYTCRFGIEMLMVHCLGEHFAPDDLAAVAAIAENRHDEYYVAMMCAWYFATALAAQEGATWPYFVERRLHSAVLTMAIRKAIESYRISPQRKAELRALRAK